MSAIHHDTATALAGAVRRGEISAVALCTSALDEIDRLGSARSGFTRVLRARALLRAEAVDKIVQAGVDPGPLAGVPFGVSDLFDVALHPTTAGSKIKASGPLAHRDAKAVALLEAAGAVLVGTQNMDEFSYGFVTVNAHYGTTLNPHDQTRLAGGAAGGSAVAVATGTVPFSLAGDTNGSLRVPAALCGVIGLTPTHDGLPRDGVFPFVDSLDVIGPLARDLDDIALVRQVLRGERPDPAPPLGSLRFGRLMGWFDRNIEPELRDPLDRFWSSLGRVRYDLEHAEIARAAASIIIAAEGAALHRPRLEQDPMAFDPATRDRLLAGLLMPSESYVQAQRVRNFLRRRSATQFETCDILFTPAAPGFAPRIADPTITFDGGRVPARSHLGLYTQPISLMGLPALVLPLRHDGPLPLAIQLISDENGEATLLKAARFLGEQGLVTLSGTPAALT